MGIIQGLDTIPVQIQRDFGELFSELLPGWFGNGEYNFKPGATTQMASAQLKVLMQNGSHPWINDQLEALLGGDEFNNSLLPGSTRLADSQTKRLAALVNFMSEASGPEALATNGVKTGGYIAFVSRSDPNLIAKLNYQPTPTQMRALTTQGLSWSNILGSEAGREVLALNPVTEVVDGVKTLKFDGKLSNGGFFSKAADEIGTWKKYKGFFAPSTQFSREWAAANRVTVVRDAFGVADGSVLKGGVAVGRAEAEALLATKTLTANGATISSFEELSSKMLKRLGVVAAVATLALLSTPAEAAQADGNYNSNLAVPANKALIEELFATGTSGLAGLVVGALGGAATAGILAIPIGMGAAYVGDKIGREIGDFFYENFTETANELAEWMTPLLTPIAEGLVDISDVIEDVAGAIFGAASDAFEYVGDLVNGSSGLFGLNGPLFGPGGPLHALVDVGQRKGFLTHDGQWAYDGFDKILYGTDGDDVLVLDEGTGGALGGKGNDVLVGIFPRYVAAGSPLIEGSPAPLAQGDTQLGLDGGEGKDKDWVITVGGDRAVTIGGLDRDWIYNTSDGGVIWGDAIGGVYEKPVVGADGKPVLNADGTPKTQPTKPEDSDDNSDDIWYAPNTVVLDAQHHDVLKFYGLTLTGGNAEGGIAGLLVDGAVGGAIGMANWAHSLDKNGKYDWTKSVYFDHLLPWVTYVFSPNADGGLDMFITDQFDQLARAIGLEPSADQQQAQELAKQGIRQGWMKIKNVDVVGSYLGYQQGSLAEQATFNMVFKAVNPLADLLTMLQPLFGLAETAVAASLGGLGLADAAMTLSAAADRFMQGAHWSDKTDPLVIDLDGDGIEMTEITNGGVYFDVDGDKFAERTGWVRGDDGFLVADANGNGRIDDISEMFGGVGVSGFADLAAWDSNGDGKVTAADARWGALQVWQDRNGDGVTDAGELSTLEALGIVSLDLAAQPLDLTTPQGTRLTGYGDVTFAGGAVRHMFDAELDSNDTDTRYAGEGGRASWQGGLTLDAKGFGSITDLSVAAANDVAFGQLVASTAAAMTTPDLRTLVAQAGGTVGHAVRNVYREPANDDELRLAREGI